MISDNMLSTTSYIGEHTTVENYGLACGVAIRRRRAHRPEACLEQCTEARDVALHKMVEIASGTGANAVVGIRFESTRIDFDLTEVVCYGTAVTVHYLEP